MSETGRRTTLLLTLIGAAASIVAISGYYWWRWRITRQEHSELRGVSEILSECHARIRDIQAQLSAGRVESG